ncbi:hypothetical protein BTVI_40506 [Pitangus sulphuratus]|nr:hypothetical protein BTVI_40506 [Pitangus sulphuratus]
MLVGRQKDPSAVLSPSHLPVASQPDLVTTLANADSNCLCNRSSRSHFGATLKEKVLERRSLWPGRKLAAKKGPSLLPSARPAAAPDLPSSSAGEPEALSAFETGEAFPQAVRGENQRRQPNQLGITTY